MRKLVLISMFCGFAMASASAQQQATKPPASVQQQATRLPASATTGDFLAQGYEIKGVINNTYLLLQKGDRAFVCGAAEGLTWTNWAEHTRDAPCKAMSNSN